MTFLSRNKLHFTFNSLLLKSAAVVVEYPFVKEVAFMLPYKICVACAGDCVGWCKLSVVIRRKLRGYFWLFVLTLRWWGPARHQTGAPHTLWQVAAMAPPAHHIHAYSEKIYTKAQCFSFFVAWWKNVGQNEEMGMNAKNNLIHYLPLTCL